MKIAVVILSIILIFSLCSLFLYGVFGVVNELELLSKELKQRRELDET